MIKKFIVRESIILLVFVIIGMLCGLVDMIFRCNSQLWHLSLWLLFLIYFAYWFIKWCLLFVRFQHRIGGGKISPAGEIITSGDWKRATLAAIIAFVIVGIICFIIYYIMK